MTSEVSLDGAAVREETEKQAPSENRGLIVFLGVLGVMIVGLSVGIVLVNARKGGDDSDNVLGSVPTEDVVIKDKIEGWDGTVPASTQASMFSKEVNEKLDNPALDYSLERAKEDYQRAFDEAGGELKYRIALDYARFVYERLDDIRFATRILESVKDIAMIDSEDARLYYDALFRMYSDKGDIDNAEMYKQLYDDVMDNYWEWNYDGKA